MSVFVQDIKKLKERQERAKKGLYNCIPFPFVRFKRYVPGTEQAKYILITANQKIKAK